MKEYKHPTCESYELNVETPITCSPYDCPPPPSDEHFGSPQSFRGHRPDHHPDHHSDPHGHHHD